MAVLARLFVAMVAFSAVALASNSTSGNTTTVTTTLTTTTTVSATVTTTITDTATTTDSNTLETVSGTITLTISGDCEAFCNDANVKMGFKQALAEVAGTGISSGNVAVTLTHTCSRRLVGLPARMNTGRTGRRLAGSVTASYTITIPAGASVTGTQVANAITGTTPTALTTSLTNKLAALGVDTSTYSVTVTGISTPTVGTVIAGPTTTVTTTLQAGVDSAAFLRKAFSSAHLWGLILLFGANHFFA